MPSMDEIPYDRLQIPTAIASKHQSGMPTRERLALARGLMPMADGARLGLCYLLAGDAVESVSEAAKKTLTTMPSRHVMAAIDRSTHPKVLEFLVEFREPDPELDECIYRLPDMNDRTARLIAQRAAKRTCDVITTNQARLLLTPMVIVDLKDNPHCPEDLYQRAASFLRMQGEFPESAMQGGGDLDGLDDLDSGLDGLNGLGDLDSGLDALGDLDSGLDDLDGLGDLDSGLDDLTGDGPLGSGLDDLDDLAAGLGDDGAEGLGNDGLDDLDSGLDGLDDLAVGGDLGSLDDLSDIDGLSDLGSLDALPSGPLPVKSDPLAGLAMATDDALSGLGEPAVDLEAEVAAAISGKPSPALQYAQDSGFGMFDLDRFDQRRGGRAGLGTFSFDFQDSSDDFSFSLTQEQGVNLEEDEGYRSIEMELKEMSVGNKIKLAFKGNKEVRKILLRDRNKTVAVAVIKSGRMTDGEIVSAAGNRNLSDDVIREISTNKEFTRKYPVQVALAANSKTPVPVALSLMKSLHKKDLKALSRNRNVSNVISVAALKLFKQKFQRS